MALGFSDRSRDSLVGNVFLSRFEPGHRHASFLVGGRPLDEIPSGDIGRKTRNIEVSKAIE